MAIRVGRPGSGLLLLFLAAAVRRQGSIWWILALALNVLQLTRFVVGVVAILGWAEPA